jgi:hypothetical protein
MTFGQNAFSDPVYAFPVMGDNVIEFHIFQFLEGVAKRALQRSVGLDYAPALQMHDENALRRLLYNGTVKLFALSQRLLGTLALGDVSNHGDEVLWSSRLIPYQRGR